MSDPDTQRPPMRVMEFTFRVEVGEQVPADENDFAAQRLQNLMFHAAIGAVNALKTELYNAAVRLDPTSFQMAELERPPESAANLPEHQEQPT